MTEVSRDISPEKLGTEERIKLAALKVFTEKGFAATRTREIADTAGINIASLHYYYRSKEKLFELVIGETMHQFSQLMNSILNGSRPLHEKIRLFVPAYLDFLSQNPFLPIFIFHESQRDPALMSRLMDDRDSLTSMQHQLRELTERKIIRPISDGSFFSLIIGSIIFPFLSKPLMTYKLDMDDTGYQQMLEDNKTHISEMLINYLYIGDFE